MGWFSKSNPPPPPVEPPQAPLPRVDLPPQLDPPPPPLSCSFCGKGQHEVKKLISGPNAYICDGCIGSCNDILAEEIAVEAPPKLSPREIEEALDEHVVGLRAAKRVLTASLRRHLLGSAQPDSEQRAPRVLLVGPSGSGKSAIGRALCAVSPVVSYHADVSRLSESGYVGEDVENFLGTLLVRADEDAARAARGLLVLDGLEKLRAQRPLGMNRDISGEYVQRELIRLLDGLDLAVPMWSHKRHPQAQTQHVAARHLCVVAAIRLELPARSGERDLRGALEEMGMLPELLARFERVVALPRPDAAALKALLDHPTGPVAEARGLVESLGGTLTYTPGAVSLLAEVAASSAEGSWLLHQLVERHLEEVLLAASAERSWVVDEGRAQALIAEAFG